MRILGIDYGAARIGLSLGDDETGLASPWGVIDRRSSTQWLEALQTVIADESVGRVVVGIPRPLADQTRTTKQAQEIRDFIEAIRSFGVPVEEENETWSTKLAERQVEERGERGKRDDLAAAVILQTYLDRQRR